MPGIEGTFTTPGKSVDDPFGVRCRVPSHEVDPDLCHSVRSRRRTGQSNLVPWSQRHQGAFHSPVRIHVCNGAPSTSGTVNPLLDHTPDTRGLVHSLRPPQPPPRWSPRLVWASPGTQLSSCSKCLSNVDTRGE